jgi:DNA polymerase
MSNGSKSEALTALRWLVEAGADEAINEEPIDRFASKSPIAPRVPASPTALGEQGKPVSIARTATAASRPRPPAEGPPTLERPNETDLIGHALDVAAGCSTLADLKAALESFEGSQLKKKATNLVFADGNPQSRVMFVGEAPGAEEDRVGLPFVGAAGKLLDLMLAAIGRDRSSAYIINVLPWRPPENRTPEATEVAQCIPFLRKHIELAQPEVMILLGAVAVRHVLGLAEGIMKYRGRWMEYRVGEKMIPVMPTLHPAYLLRQPAHKRLAWRDLQAVESKIASLNLPPKSQS